MVDKKRAALFYAQYLGFYIIPLHGVENNQCTCKRPQCPQPGKHPILPQWVEQATNDPEVISRWFDEYPYANIGHVLGRRGVIVIDFDLKNNPQAHLEFRDWLRDKFKIAYEELGAPRIQTPSGGFHLVFRAPVSPSASFPYTTEWSHVNYTHGLPYGVEIFSGKRMTILPPSQTPLGTYEWDRETYQLFRELYQNPPDPDEAFYDIFPIFPDELWQWCFQVTNKMVPDDPSAATEIPPSQKAYLWDETPIPEGYRHIHLTSLAGKLRSIGLSPESIYNALKIENERRCSPPLPEKEVYQIAFSMGKYPPYPTNVPKIFKQRSQRASPPAIDSITPDVLLQYLKQIFTEEFLDHVSSTFPNYFSPFLAAVQATDEEATDMMLAEVITPYAENRYCFVPAYGWLYFDDLRWCSDEENLSIISFVKNMLYLLAYFLLQRYPERLKSIRAFLLRNLKVEAINRIIRGLESPLNVPVSQFDSDPYLLNCLNGVLDLRDKTLYPHDPKFYCTKIAYASFIPDVNPEEYCPKWLNFLNEIFLHRQDLVQYIQYALGYSLTGDTSEHVFFILWGTGRNGKSTLINTVQGILNNYAVSVASDVFVSSRSGGDIRSYWYAHLKGARMAIASETEEFAVLQHAKLKALTGSDKIAARLPYQRPFEFTPTHKLWLMTNHKPQVKDTSEGMWNRIRLIPFERVFTEDEVIPNYHEQLLDEERDVIFSWLVDGASKWAKAVMQNRKGLPYCEAVIQATKEYRTESDVLLAWLDSCCRTNDPNAITPVSDLYQSYKEWCESQGEEPVSDKKFGRLLTEKGFKAIQLPGGKRCRKGIKLIEKEAEALF